MRRSLLLAFAATLGLSIAGPAALAQSPPTVVYEENFQNVAGPDPVLRLTDYRGATGQAYTAHAAWLTNCNGWVASFSQSPTAAAPVADCGAQSWWNNTQQLAHAFGTFNQSADPAGNYAVSAFTAGDPGAGRVEFATVTNVAFPSSSRFVTFGVDVAAINCHARHPLLQFSLLNDAGSATPVGSAIDGCTSPTTVTAPAIGVRGALAGIRVGRYTSNGAMLFSGTSIGVRMVNNQGSGSGNDHAFDNIRILDVTPSLSKTFSPARLNAGAPSTLTFTITNTSELGAKNGWSFTDNLPAGLVVASPEVTSSTCPGTAINASAGAGAIGVTGNLAAGSPSCTVSVNVTAAGAGTYTNCTQNVTTAGLNPPPCAPVEFLAADLEVAKSAQPQPVVAGRDVTYSITVTNHGPSEAVNAVVSDDLPDGLTFVSASPECGEANGTLTCAVGTLPAGHSRVYTVTMRTPSSLEHCPENSATVTSETFDPNAVNNVGRVCPGIEGRVDLSIAKTPSRTPVPIGGGQVIYTLVVQNDGPSDATGVRVDDSLPPGLTVVGAEASQGACDTAGDAVSCDLGELAAGGSAQVLVTANAWATAGDIANTATVRGDQVETAPDDNRATATVTVSASASPSPPPAASSFDLVIDKVADDRTAVIGQPVTYRIVVRNAGPDAAPGVRLTDTLSAPVRVASARTTAGSCIRRIPLACELGVIEPGASVTLTVVAKHREAGGGQRNAVTVAGAGTDADPDDNLDTVDVRARKVRLRVAKVASRARVAAGDSLAYAIRVRNPTRGEARRVQVCDRLPSGLVFVRATRKATLRAGRRCWTIARLGARATRSFRVAVRTLPGTSGRKINTATVTSSDVRRARARRAVRVVAGGVSPGGVTG